MIWTQNEKTAALRDQLVGTLIGLSRATFGNEHLVTASTCQVVLDGLQIVGKTADDEALLAAAARADEEKRNLVPMCYSCASPCGRTSNYDMNDLWAAEEAIRDAKLRVLSGLCDMACTYPDGEQVYSNEQIREPLLRALFVVGEDWDPEEFEPIEQELRTLVHKD